MLAELSNVESELRSLREALSQKEGSLRRLQSAEAAETSELKLEVFRLASELKEKEKQLHESAAKSNQLAEQKLQLEKESRSERTNYTMKVLEVNKCLDETKAEFLRMVHELEL